MTNIKLFLFKTEIFPYSIELAEYLFNLMTDNSSSLTVENYCKAGNQIVSSNADVSFYVRLFAAQKQHLTIHGNICKYMLKKILAKD